MITVVVLALCCVILFGLLPVALSRARWPDRAPRAAIALWQAIGLAGSLAGIGTALAVASAPLHVSPFAGLFDLVSGKFTGHHGSASLNPYQSLGLGLVAYITGGLIGGFVATALRTMRSRAHHRQLVDLVGERGVLPGAIVLQHPLAVAYCLPGIRPRIVLSAGTLEVLQDAELNAVVAHEEGHAVAHHELVLLPLVSFIGPFRWVPYSRLAPTAVATLLEMAADDFASRRHGRRTVASALVNLVSAGAGAVPACAFAMAGSTVTTRVHRLLGSSTNSRMLAAGALLASGGVLGLPLVAMLGRF